jgi:hypothetical protein
MILSFIFFIGTAIAAIGWFAEWKHLKGLYPIFEYAGWMALAGHALQVIAAFGKLLTPDFEAEEPEDDTSSPPDLG